MPEKVYTPEVFEPEERLPADLVALRRFAFYMDEAFEVPGTRMRVGVGSIIGLVPGVGDVVGALFASWIVIGALRHRVPARIIVRMVFNILIDLVFGSIPVAGDLFDFLFEENVRNMRLLEAHRNRARPPRTSAQIALVAGAIVATILLLGLILLIAVIVLVIWLVGQRPWF